MIIKPAVLQYIAQNGRPLDEIITPVAAALSIYFPVFGIDTLFRAAHFLGQAAHETDGFHTLVEYASGDEYEGRDDLGNTQPGDGRLFKGRGIFDLTGRDNYVKMGARLSLDLVSSPEQAAQPDIASHVACLFWDDFKMNDWADEDNYKAITRRINGGFNGLASRLMYLNRAKTALKTYN